MQENNNNKTIKNAVIDACSKIEITKTLKSNALNIIIRKAVEEQQRDVS
jgi:hypothetical protein